MRNKLIIALVSPFLCMLNSGCIGSAYEKKLNGGYYLEAIDSNDEMSLCYQVEGNGFTLINATVYAVGQNEKFIIVKQRPREFPNFPDKILTHYFIVPLLNRLSNSPDKNIYGPLTSKEFEKKLKELGASDIKFTIVFDNLK